MPLPHYTRSVWWDGEVTFALPSRLQTPFSRQPTQCGCVCARDIMARFSRSRCRQDEVSLIKFTLFAPCVHIHTHTFARRYLEGEVKVSAMLSIFRCFLKHPSLRKRTPLAESESHHLTSRAGINGPETGKENSPRRNAPCSPVSVWLQ